MEFSKVVSSYVIVVLQKGVMGIHAQGASRAGKMDV